MARPGRPKIGVDPLVAVRVPPSLYAQYLEWCEEFELTPGSSSLRMLFQGALDAQVRPSANDPYEASRNARMVEFRET
jgi:hypothetical protein